MVGAGFEVGNERSIHADNADFDVGFFDDGIGRHEPAAVGVVDIAGQELAFKLAGDVFEYIETEVEFVVSHGPCVIAHSVHGHNNRMVGGMVEEFHRVILDGVSGIH